MVEAALVVWTLLTRPAVAAAVEEVRAVALSWEGVGALPHRFGGCEFRLRGREIGHLHGNGVLDLPLSRALRGRLVAEGRGREHHTHPGTSWLSFPMEGAGDAAPALGLLLLAYEMRKTNSEEESCSV